MAEEKNVFIHHVFFWLAEPGNIQHQQQLTDGLKKLSKVSTIRRYHIGRPADTSRDVIDSSYSVSWCLFFSNAADQESYQVDPIHLRFIDECRHLWKKVTVFDSVDA
jgi:Stress responsive A/B Barrel Domain